MDHQNFPFATYPYTQSAMDGTVFQPHVFTRVEESHYNHPSYLDPSLHQTPSPSAPYLSQWEPPQVKRWVTDDQRTTLFNADPLSKMMTAVARPPLGAHHHHNTAPPPSHNRFASPISSIDYAFSAPSPLAPDTESYYDNNNNLPSTPSDTALLSPYSQPVQFEYYNQRDRNLQFLNMGGAIPPAFVKPEEVDPSHSLGYHDAEVSQADFSLDHRSYSFESTTSQNDLEQGQGQITVAFQGRRVTSPDVVVKEEIEAFTSSSRYPPPPRRQEEDEDDTSDVPEEKPTNKRKKDDDHEYTPGGKKARPNPSSSSPRRTRAKPIAPPKPAAADPPSKRKTRVAASTASQASPPAARTATSSSAMSSKAAHTCPHCDQASFKDASSLESHVKKQHTRPFKCVFHFAGCESTFASKNEWKRHNSTQHLVLHYWLCTDGHCAKNNAASVSFSPSKPSKSSSGSSGSSTLYNNTFNTSSSSSSSSAASGPPGVRFNRKDLYTQHVRRMHMPPQVKKALKQAVPVPAQPSSGPTTGNDKKTALETTKQHWEDRLRAKQEAALRDRVQLPTYMRCPARACGAEFRGKDAWDARMEHVAKHLESGDKGDVVFGGEGDATLMAWAGREDVGVVVRGPGGRGWVLRNPLRRSGGSAGGRMGKGKEVVVEEEEEEVEEVVVVDGEGEEDAEGESDDE